MSRGLFILIAFLSELGIGILLVLRGNTVQAAMLGLIAKYPPLAVFVPFKRFRESPYYLLLLRIVGVAALIMSGFSLYMLTRAFN
jgi:hypothetical protein